MTSLRHLRTKRIYRHKVRHGDLVRVSDERRKYVALRVSDAERKRFRLNVASAGIHLWGGLWYKGDVMTHKPYGKVLDLKYLRINEVRIVGKIRTRYAAQRHCR